MKTFVAFTLLCTAALAADVVPVPRTSLLPVTPNSHPFMAASQTLSAEDLAKSGYVEEEYLVSGTANVYDWAPDGSISVKTPGAPYTDRILIRRPSDPGKFSGTVVVELMNSARRFDWAMMWGFLHDSLIDHGDAWAGVTTPGAVAGLQKFDAKRYAALSFANPTPGAVCEGAKGGPPAMEEGLRWDMLSQIAAALKSSSGPMGRAAAQRVFMTTQAGDITTYVNAIHAHAKLANGRPAFDGYLIKNLPGAGRISQCAAAPARGDSRVALKNIDVPVIAVVAQGEVLQAAPLAKPDSDDPQGRFRMYEIAGAAHMDKYAYAAMPVFADQIAAAGSAQGTPEWPFNAPCTPAIPLSDHPLLKYSYDAALQNLDAWVRKGVAPPKADRMHVEDGKLELDQYGNGLGGVRSPYVDVPVAKYTTTSPGPGTCAELGEVLRFDAARFKMLYGDQKTYASKFSQAIDKMVKERFLTEQDAKRLKASLASAAR